MLEVDVAIRRAQDLGDYHACVELQEEVWAASMRETHASLAILKIANEHGGSVLLAEDGTGRTIGFSFAMLGKGIWWSHMTAVTPEYRTKQVGLSLKLRQREEALKEGIGEIQWTFDPLRALNAHFNFHKLGVIVRRYEENAYGTTNSALHHGLPTDRFIAEWHLRPDRENGIILRDLNRIPRINSSEADARFDLADDSLLLEIPADIENVADPRAWQSMLRDVCRHYFAQGYMVEDFFRLDRPLYLLSRTSARL